MVKVVSMAKTSTVNHSTPVVHAKLRACCQDLEEWPRSWMGFAEDIPPGEKMVAYFRPFIEHLIGLNLSQKTIRKHVDNLWTLGGEIIRDLNETDPDMHGTRMNIGRMLIRAHSCPHRRLSLQLGVRAPDFK